MATQAKKGAATSRRPNAAPTADAAFYDRYRRGHRPGRIIELVNLDRLSAVPIDGYITFM